MNSTPKVGELILDGNYKYVILWERKPYRLVAVAYINLWSLHYEYGCEDCFGSYGYHPCTDSQYNEMTSMIAGEYINNLISKVDSRYN